MFILAHGFRRIRVHYGREGMAIIRESTVGKSGKLAGYIVIHM